MLSRAEVEAIRLRGNEDVDALLAHIAALEAFWARVLAVARRLRDVATDRELVKRQNRELALPATVRIHSESAATDAYVAAVIAGRDLLLALAEEAGDD